MEATATASTTGSATGSQTIADLIPCAAAAHGENTAIRYKRDGAWHDVSYSKLAEIAQEIGLGLIDLGLEAGERICILGNTRPEWSYADMAATSAGAVVVPIYQTNSPEECLWVISDSEACAIVCEDQEQLEKIAAIREQVPNLRTIIVIDPLDESAIAKGPSDAVRALNAIPLDQVRERGRSRTAEELEARRSAVRLEDPFTFIYTSGTTGPPKGCVLTHGNYRAIIDMVGEAGEIQGDEVIYLYLPLAHSFALLDPARRVRPRRHARLLRRRHQADHPRAAGGQTDLPALRAARVREDLHARPGRDPGPAARGAGEGQGRDRARREGARHDQPRRRRARRAAQSRSTRPTRSCSRTSAPSSAATCATPPAAPRRSPKRSSNSSGPAACPCSRATA